MDIDQECVDIVNCSKIHIEQLTRIMQVETELNKLRCDVTEILTLVKGARVGARFAVASFATMGKIIFFFAKLAAAASAILGFIFLVEQVKK